MLQVAPDADIETETDEETDDALYCAACGVLVTRGRWRLSIDGFEHTFTNPVGVSFRILCFTKAPGASSTGAETIEHTWFRGYRWNYANCRGCGDHLGWRYSGEAAPPVFFGLIKPKLTDRPR